MPHWPGHEPAIECYWRCWEIAFQNFRRATDDNGFVCDFASTMFNDCLYMWDSVFITLFGRYGDRAFKFQHTLDNFYGKQHPDGGICRQFREHNGSECYSRFDPAGSGPNVLGLSEYEYFLQFGDRKRVSQVFPALVAYGLWNRKYRTWPNGSYWGTGLSSGMDNQPRIPQRADRARARAPHLGGRHAAGRARPTRSCWRSPTCWAAATRCKTSPKRTRSSSRSSTSTCGTRAPASSTTCAATRRG